MRVSGFLLSEFSCALSLVEYNGSTYKEHVVALEEGFAILVVLSLKLPLLEDLHQSFTPTMKEVPAVNMGKHEK